MKAITPGSLLIGLILSAPGLWRAWSDPTIDVSGAIVRFLLAVLFASVSINILQSVIDSYRRGVGRARLRNTGDRLSSDGSPGAEGKR